MIFGGRATIPVAALRRRHAHEAKKAPGPLLVYFKPIIVGYCIAIPGISWKFKPSVRYANIARCRYGPDFVIGEWLIRVRVDRRKNLQYESTWLFIARLQNPGEVGVYHAPCLAHRVFGGRK